MRRRIIIAGLLLSAAWAVAAVVVVLQTLRAADDAEAALQETRRELSIDALVDGTAEENLGVLRTELGSVASGAGSPVLAPLRIVPGVGRQIEAAEALGTAGQRGTAIGADMLEELAAIVDGPLPEGSERLELIDRVRVLLAEGRAEIDALDLGPDGPLVSPLADARERAENGLGDLRDFLQRGETASLAVRHLFAEGDYLVLAANNAEMRAGSGMFLQIGELAAQDGELDVGELHPAKDILLPPGRVEAQTPTYDELWGFLDPTVEWRNLALSPRFDVTAELATRMWEGLGNDRPTGVIAVDPFAIRAVLRATGPVEVDGRTIGADDVVPFLLNEQYEVFRDLEGYDDYVAEQAARRDLLGGLVDAMFDGLGQPGTDAVELLEELRDAVRGRHLMAWSSEPAIQQGWSAIEMTGELAVDSVMVSLSNRGINKLDPFVEVEVDVAFEDVAGPRTRGVMDIVVRNRTPDGEVVYVAGPVEGIQGVDAYGDYAGILTVILPGVARQATIEGQSSLLVARPDGPALTVATFVSVDQGGEVHRRVIFDVPDELDQVRIEPSARPQPVEWEVDGRTRNDSQHHTVPIDPAPAGVG